MTIAQSPYSAFAALLDGSGFSVAPAELHGYLLGRVCAGADFAAERWLQDAADLLGSEPEGAVRQALLGLQTMLREELTAEELVLPVLLLPVDEAPIAERLVALAQWCQSFGDGFAQAWQGGELDAEARETLDHLQAISLVSDEASDDDEGDEDSYLTLVEFVRCAAQLLFVSGRSGTPAPTTLH